MATRVRQLRLCPTRSLLRPPGFYRHARPLPAAFPRPVAPALHRQRRYKSDDATPVEEETGHVEAKANEGLLFLDNIFPLKLYLIFGLPIKSMLNLSGYVPSIVKHLNAPSVAAADADAITDKSTPDNLPVKFEEIIPRDEEGGLFLKFHHDANEDPRDIERRVRKHLKEHAIRPWFNPFRTATATLVKGVPWLEDLRRLPSTNLKVEFVPPQPGQPAEELSEETLYALFRRYGRLRDIVPQATDSKELPKYATLDFGSIRSAIRAKTCMHGYTVNSKQGGGNTGTMIKLTYKQRKKSHFIWDWIANHPRITIPLFAALLGTLAVAIFDPIRTFSIKVHVTRQFHISDNRLVKWFMSQATKANELLNLRLYQTENRSLNVIWSDRKDIIQQVQTWLMETADTFIVVQGPRGSGKKELIMNQSLKNRKNVLYIDCKTIQEARGDSGTISAAANQVNYRPVFSWMNNISSLVDLASQGLIGTKAGFSETLETQLQKIWQSTTSALREIALEGRHKTDKDANLGADEYLESHPEKRPIVVIDNYLHRSQENTVVYDKLAQWAANLTTANISHVIFLTDDVSYAKTLSKALPDRVFRQISLGDCSPEVAKRFVINHLDADAEADDSNSDDGTPKLPPSKVRDDLSELDSCISTLGGRLTDLGYLARRIKSGEAPTRAVKEIIDQSASEILKVFIWDADKSKDVGGDDRARPWTPEQAWQLIKSLAANESIRYNELLLDSTYKLGPEGETVLRALEQAELITIVSWNGRPGSIKPGRPVYTAAFKQLTSDAVLSARLELGILAKQITGVRNDISAAEDELKLLGQIPGGSSGVLPAAVHPRVTYLLNKVHSGQASLDSMEKKSAQYKDVLKKDF